VLSLFIKFHGVAFGIGPMLYQSPAAFAFCL